MGSKKDVQSSAYHEAGATQAPPDALVGAISLARSHPHDFTLQYPIRREYFFDRFAQPAGDETGHVVAALGSPAVVPGASPQPLLLYVHVPFCAAKCYYCNFAVDTRADVAVHERYVRALETQLARVAALVDRAGVPIGGIDIGGGTPTLLAMPLLERLCAALAPFRTRARQTGTAPVPLSIESTPAIAASEPAKLAALVAAGIDRVSIGVQSTNETTLAAVNRTAQRGLNERAVAGLRAAGFSRVSADLIFALPGQTRAQWDDDLSRVLALETDSVTVYDCLYRGKGRSFVRALAPSSADRASRVPSWPEVYGPFYDHAYERLTAAGLRAPYGSVNFSRHAGESGTSAYFERRLVDGAPYLGVGNYASSLLGGRWSFAPYTVSEYCARVLDATETLPAAFAYSLPRAEIAAKYALLALSFGVLSSARFERAIGTPLDEQYGAQLAYAVEAALLAKRGSDYLLVPGAFGRMPLVRALFHSPESIAWTRDNVADAAARRSPRVRPSRRP